MFKVNPEPTFPGAAVIAAPGGGEATLKLVFRHKTREAAQAYFERAAKGEEPEVVLMLEIVAGWEDVDMPFSAEALGQVLQNYHGAPKAIYEAYATALHGGRRGN